MLNPRLAVCICLILLVSAATAACAPAPAPVLPANSSGGAVSTNAPASGGPVALTITGAVAKPLSLTMDALKGMEMVKLATQHPKLGNQNYEGVRLNTLLTQAQVKPEATKLVLNAGDGFTGEVPLADVQKCADCLLGLNNGKLDAAMPGMASNVWVKDVVKIELK